nr:hypothetical protein [Morchella crassipes]
MWVRWRLGVENGAGHPGASLLARRAMRDAYPPVYGPPAEQVSSYIYVYIYNETFHPPLLCEEGGTTPPKGPWPSVKGRKSPLSPQIFIFKFFPRPLRRRSGTARGGGKKIKKWKEGRPPPPFQTITHVVVMKRGGDLEKGVGALGWWGGEKSRKFFFII